MPTADQMTVQQFYAESGLKPPPETPVHMSGWLVGYDVGFCMIAAVVLAMVMFRIWRSFIRAAGPWVGIVIGAPLSLAIAIPVAIICGAIWPLTALAPVALHLARKGRSAHDERPDQRQPQFRARHAQQEFP